jgi:Ca-activated chloride channel family protein
VALKGKEIPESQLPNANFVFLLDVSGSMSSENKLPLLKSSLRMLLQKLRPEDRVAIVVYAGAAGLVLPSTPATEKDSIMAAFERLEAGGSTAGGAGIKLAYQVAVENFIKGGNNRVILATDGDFNIGASSDAEMERLIEEKRESGVFLTCLGFGMGNYKDSKMEKLADAGNGNYAYIDNLREAKKVMYNEFGGTMFTIAKDVKLQLEFNPAVVASYRLIGYENRVMAREDFDNDQKDAGDLGSGHTVTAFYEINPQKGTAQVESGLKYQTTALSAQASTSEALTLQLRYKLPNEDVSKLLEKPVANRPIKLNRLGSEAKFALAVASFGQLLRGSQYKGSMTTADILKLAEGNLGEDKEGYRKEFLELVKQAGPMLKK